MEPAPYRPWRTDEQADQLLADQVSDRWRALLQDARRTVAQLREAVDHAADQANAQPASHTAAATHARMFTRLRAFEHRLEQLERTLEPRTQTDPEPRPAREHRSAA